MLSNFRNVAKSKVGIAVVMGFLALLMLSFAAGDISNYFSGFNSTASGEAVASVDGDDIPSNALQKEASNALENVRQSQKDPTLTMKALLAGGVLDQLLTTLIDRKALVAFGADHGIIASPKLVGSEFGKVGAFRGPDGKFSESLYNQLLAQRGLTDAEFRENVIASLVARQLLLPAEYAAVFPNELSLRYAALLKERRIGAIALLPSAAFGGKIAPSDSQLNEFYTKRRNDYMRPERRVIRFARFDESAIQDVPAPTDAEVAKRYADNKAQYAASETRKVTQLILPTDAAAKAVLSEVNGGKSLEAAASAKGLGAATLDGISKEALSGQSSQAVADATFAATRGTLIGPVRSPLGWHLMRIDAVTGKPGRTLDQVRGEIVTALGAEKRRTALSDFSAEVQEEFENGSALSDVAKKLGITIDQTEQLTADGGVFGKAEIRVNPELMSVLTTAFGMEQGQNPEIAEIIPGKTFMMFDVATVMPSAPAPLTEIRDQVVADYGMAQGALAAKAAADKVLAATKRGETLADAVSAIGVAGIPPVDQVTMSREQLGANMEQVPPPLRLLFRMASGSIKILPAPRKRGFYIVQVKTIEPAKLAANDGFVNEVRREYSLSAGREYAEQLRLAIRNEVGVKRNEAAVKALTKTLTGGGGN
jgi:peptidyl-prolyl cis-trans isomerase D